MTTETFTSMTGARIDYTAPPAAAARPAYRVGGTPRGASTTAGITAMDDTYGGPASVSRLFFQGSLPACPAPANDGRLTVASFTSMAGLTPEIVKSYGRVTLDHEINRKSIPTWASDMDKLIAMGTGNVCVIFTGGGLADPNFMTNLKQYMRPGIKLVGVDMDGVSFPDHYHSYETETKNAAALAEAYGCQWFVPEHGAARAANDPDGTVRSAWLANNVRMFREAGALDVCLWEQDGPKWPGVSFTTPAEAATVSTLFRVCR